MDKTERTVSELSTLFRMIQVIPDADSASRIYQMLLAFCTTWTTIGFERAFLLLVDSSDEVVKGRLAAERTTFPLEASSHQTESSFEKLAKNVFDNYEQIESSELTLHTQAFGVGLDWTRSAIVKAATTGYPVLAERMMTEFDTDPFFDYFATGCYIAVPIRVGSRVLGVLAADNGRTGQAISVEDVSLVHSLSQQAALSVERLMDSADNRRRFRILRKVQEIMRNAETAEQLAEGFNLALSMICRAVGGSGAFLKDFVRNRTLHIKTVDEYTVDAGESDIALGESFERILDRCAGSMRPLRGDRQYPLLGNLPEGSVCFFYACPLIVAGGGLGALAVYLDSDATVDRLGARDRTFLELCAGIIADRLNALHKSQRVDRVEDMIEEIRSNLVRERDASRFGERALEFYQDLTEALADLREVIFSRLPYEKRVARAKELFAGIERESDVQMQQLEAMRASLSMVDLFALVGEVVDGWTPEVADLGVEVTRRIPANGPTLLASADSIRTAVQSVLRTLAAGVESGDRVLIECTTDGDRAMICIADTGEGLPGHLLSRLFMPFAEFDDDDEDRSAMSVAGDILHRHGGEISVKSSPSWKTILVIALPMSANRDRRYLPGDRRRRHDRRTEPAGA